MIKKLILWTLLLGGLGALGGWYYVKANNKPVGFRTVQVERGDLLATINSTGTIEPEEVVDVGAQVAGQIVSFGRDPYNSSKTIDFGTQVKKDTVLARIDESLYKAQVDRSKAGVEQADAGLASANAQVAVADANLKRAQADLDQMKAKLNQSQRDFVRAKQLWANKSLADVDYDTSEALYLTNRSTLAVGEATIVQAKASLQDARANVEKAKASLHDAQAALSNSEINLGYCTIKSPVDGVIVDRRVNIGQTVVSSLNAPSLFLIAKDLKRLQVWASVNEADIGNIFSGQSVTFTVDAFPGQVFNGVVAPAQPRLNASMTQNVVTYTVVVDTDNTDNRDGKPKPGKLKPYLTANMRFEVSKHHDVLLVPNTALRWKPNPQLVVPEERGEYISAQRRTKAAPGEKPIEEKKEHPDQGILWVEDGGFVRPVKVHIGLSDGLMTEVTGDEVKDGLAVVVGETRANTNAGTTNPFAPKMFGK